MNVHPQKRRRGRPANPVRRGEVLDAALEMFAERGFHGATMEEISIGSIYRHFASKETLVNELYQHHKRALAETLGADVPDTKDLRVLFNHLWWRLYAFVQYHPLALAFLELHHHGTYLDEQSRDLERRVIAPIGVLVLHGRANGQLKPHLSMEALITTVWGAFCGMIKASRLGYYSLTDTICSQVELTCWDAIRNHDYPDGAKR
jgi:AcrR family transcriptional regulator